MPTPLPISRQFARWDGVAACNDGYARSGSPMLRPSRVAEFWGKARATPLTDASGFGLTPRPDRHGTDGFFATVLRRVGG